LEVVTVSRRERERERERRRKWRLELGCWTLSWRERGGRNLKTEMGKGNVKFSIYT
jgi:hypothetical protein